MPGRNDPLPYHSGRGPSIPFILQQFPDREFPEGEGGEEYLYSYQSGNVKLPLALEPNRACAVTRPTKKDSASGRSDSSSAIQSRKHEQNGTRYCEVV